MQAGYRGQAPYVTFLFFRLVTPVVALVVAAFYLFVVLELDQPPMVKIGICLVAAYLGMQLPHLFLKNTHRTSASSRSSAPFPTRSTCC